jgi:MFS family permease
MDNQAFRACYHEIPVSAMTDSTGAAGTPPAAQGAGFTGAPPGEAFSVSRALRRLAAAFTYPNFRQMWLGACTSSIGTWMQKLAQSWLLLQLGGSPFWLGLDAFLGELPIFSLALLAGVAADRIDRKRLLLMSQCVQMSCAFMLAVLFGTHAARVWHILALSFITGTAQAFGAPAYQSILPSLVPREQLPQAIAMNSIQFNLARLLGPMLGGLALSALGAAWCFGLNGFSFVAVIVSLLMLSVRFEFASKGETVLESMRDGLRFLRRRANMITLVGISFLCTFLGIPIQTFLAVFARDIYHGTEKTYTLLLSVQASGAIAGAMWVAARGRRSGLGRTALFGLLALSGCLMAFALANNMIWACATLLLGGVALMICFAMLSSMVQLITPDNMRGRVMSIYNIAFRGGGPLGSLAAGSLIPSFGAPAVLAANGALLGLLALYLIFVHRKIAAL